MKVSDFDKIFILHLSCRLDRYKHIQYEFKRMDLIDNIDIWWTCKRPVSKICGEAIEDLHTSAYDGIVDRNPNIYAGVFNCSFEHYTMIKTSYERGLKNIIIFEDDISFCEDRRYFDKCLRYIPNDFSICKLYHSYEDKDGLETFKKHETNKPPLFSKIDDKCPKGLQSTAAYCLSRKGMREMIKSYDTKFTCADVAFYGVNFENVYINNYKILYVDGGKSDIL